MPPSLSFHSFFFLSWFFLFLFLSLLVAVRRPCSSIYPLSFFFLFEHIHSQIDIALIRSLLVFFSFRSLFLSRSLFDCLSLFSALHSENGREKITTTIITNTKRTASGTKMYADSRFCTLTTLFSTRSLFLFLFLLPSHRKENTGQFFVHPLSSLCRSFITFFFYLLD